MFIYNGSFKTLLRITPYLAGAFALAATVSLCPIASAQTLQAPRTERDIPRRIQGGGEKFQAVPAARPSIPGGPSDLRTLTGTEAADFCCKSGSGGSGTGCSQYDSDVIYCKDFTLHCDGSWSCQPGGSSCECL
jgi:hypothetical protein